MESLEDLRLEIDKIDKNIVELFEKRMHIAAKLGEIKKEQNLPILSAEREKDVRRKNMDHLDDQELIPYLEDFYKKVMDISREYQGDLSDKIK